MATIKNFFRHKAGAYRSGLEQLLQQQLHDAGIDAKYEPGRITYIGKIQHYTPDFILPNGIVIESKGYFTSADRAKHLLIKQQHPSLDLRFIFQNPKNRLNKKSKTTYGDWCSQHGFVYAVKTIPEHWLNQPKDERSITALESCLLVNGK